MSVCTFRQYNETCEWRKEKNIDTILQRPVSVGYHYIAWVISLLFQQPYDEEVHEVCSINSCTILNE